MSSVDATELFSKRTVKRWLFASDGMESWSQETSSWVKVYGPFVGFFKVFPQVSPESDVCRQVCA